MKTDNIKKTTASSVIALFPDSIEGQDLFLKKLIDEVLGGYISASLVEFRMWCFEDTIRRYRANERIKAALDKEAEKYAEIDGELPF